MRIERRRTAIRARCEVLLRRSFIDELFMRDGYRCLFLLIAATCLRAALVLPVTAGPEGPTAQRKGQPPPEHSSHLHRRPVLQDGRLLPEGVSPA